MRDQKLLFLSTSLILHHSKQPWALLSAPGFLNLAILLLKFLFSSFWQMILIWTETTESKIEPILLFHSYAVHTGELVSNTLTGSHFVSCLKFFQSPNSVKACNLSMETKNILIDCVIHTLETVSRKFFQYKWHFHNVCQATPWNCKSSLNDC